jgi:hypothetical protein
MDIFHLILSNANDLARHFPWDALVASGVISPLLVGVKKWRITKNVESLFKKDWFVYLTLLLLSALTAAGNYLLHTPTSDPTIIAIQTAVVAFLTQPIYFFIVKPALAYFRGEINRAAEHNLQIKSAAVPVGGLPTSQDFSQ